MAIPVDIFRSAMGQFPGAVTLITTGSGDQRSGITATAVCSVTDSPPSLLVCVNRKSPAQADIARLRQFSVHLLQSGEADIARQFAGATGAKGAAKFEAGEWGRFDCGLPRLMGALVSLACAVTEAFEVGSHTIFVGRIEEAHLQDGEALLYARSTFGRLIPLD
ncbi:MAG: flavin reductase family protein [Paracoccaceae bacterium]